MKKQNINAPRITVVVPAYNEEKYLRQTNTFLRRQNYPNFEILVVNNASTDRTEEIAKKHADRVVYEPKKGFYYSMYKGLIEAKGEIVVRSDADNKPEKDWLYFNTDLRYYFYFQFINFSGNPFISGYESISSC